MVYNEHRSSWLRDLEDRLIRMLVVYFLPLSLLNLRHGTSN